MEWDRAVISLPVWQKQKGEGRDKSVKGGKGIPLPFSLPPYPLPLSTPATQAIIRLLSGLLYLSRRETDKSLNV